MKTSNKIVTQKQLRWEEVVTNQKFEFTSFPNDTRELYTNNEERY